MYVKYQMPLIAVSDVGRSKRFYCCLLYTSDAADEL